MQCRDNRQKIIDTFMNEKTSNIQYLSKFFSRIALTALVRIFVNLSRIQVSQFSHLHGILLYYTYIIRRSFYSAWYKYLAERCQ